MKLPVSICFQGNQRPGCILMHEAKNDTQVKYLPPTGYNFLIREKAQKHWLLKMRVLPWHNSVGGSDPGLLAGVSMSLPCPCSTQQTLVYCQCYVLLCWKCAHLRKPSFLVTPMVVNLIIKRCRNICKIYRLIKMKRGRKASVPISTFHANINVLYFCNTAHWVKFSSLLCML
jgi:hypothetical protein